jgi:Domain of unknown function (DUF4388)
MLKGSLEDFSPSDIFRLLSFTKKTGRLEIYRGAGDGRVFFRDGEVYFAQSSFKKEPLGQKLVRSGALSEGQLRKALGLHATTGERVGEILLQGGAISEEQLSAAVREQIEDAVFDLLRWEVGEFVFEPHERFTVEIPISVSVENLIVEASRRLDELNVIRRRIPSPDVVLAVAPTPPEGAKQINITPAEWRLLVLVDGMRTVGEVVDVAGLDEFSGLRTLHGLLTSGLVDVTSLGPEEPASPIARPRTRAPTAPAETDHFEERMSPTESLADVAPGHAIPPEGISTLGPSAAAFDDPLQDPLGLVNSEPGSPIRDDGAPPDSVDGSDDFLAGVLAGDRPSTDRLAAGEGVDIASDQPAADVAQPVDRAAVVRELAGLFSDEDQAPQRPSPPSPGPDRPNAPKRRVEDDEEINKGLIGRFINGVKGM